MTVTDEGSCRKLRHNGNLSLLCGVSNGQLAAAGSLITALVSGKVIAPEEPWIRGYLGLPAP